MAVGGYGNDTVNGAAGADTLEGGSGNDHFAFTDLTHSTTGAADVVWDFKAVGATETDKIVLTGLGITGIGAGATEFTITNTGIYKVITHNSSTFQINLLGYYAAGTDIIAADFVF
ncbi:MAG: hypothetical protein J0L97_04100 [Alphaproteobacteria bacterium]|nr:hypothetical protein [Alphaproteobacteria bacterium]